MGDLVVVFMENNNKTKSHIGSGVNPYKNRVGFKDKYFLLMGGGDSISKNNVGIVIIGVFSTEEHHQWHTCTKYYRLLT